MKYVRNYLGAVSILPILLAACNAAAPTAAPEQARSQEAPAVTEEAIPVTGGSLQALDLPEPQAGAEMKWYDQSTLVFVPPGDAIMGGLENVPEYTVSLSGYWIYKYNVTNGMYRQCLESGACDSPAQEPPYPAVNRPDLKDFPVIGVTWGQAQAYCQWMDARLPTDAEWEKAARGENGNLYPWGESEPSCDLANIAGCRQGTTRVNEFPAGASPYGVFDMAGNVFEWVGDWYSPDYIPDVDNPRGPESGDQRVVRSSAYNSGADFLPAANRFKLQPDAYRADLGFRCVVHDPQGFAPFCQTNAYVPLPTDSDEVPACEPPVPTIDVTSYCIDRSTGTGGANVRLGDVYAGFGFTVGDCEHDYAVGGLVCSGPENSTVPVTVSTSCDLPGDDLIFPTCDAGYTLAGDACEYTGPPTGTDASCPSGAYYSAEEEACISIASSQSCPEGYAYDAALGCCGANYTEPQEPAESYSFCPVGYVYNYFALADSSYCSQPYPQLDVEFAVQLGDCPDIGRDGGGTCSLTSNDCPQGVDSKNCVCW
ncbi:MAG: SUMF1/EgtB/PvdO family nonheme iron enzyme [Anaerolineales bacterium]|nr:SUMF1/EgtB/PvdO family nonheme iron enzyme [Anaerolineales bacterium]